MLEQLREAEAQEFNDPESYLADFKAEGLKPENTVLWKLECRQTFREPGDPSWEAWDRGDREEAMRILQDTADKTRQTIETMPYELRRVRVVQMRLTEYLEWELAALRQQSEFGEQVRIVEVPTGDPLLQQPETIAFNTAVYEIVYDQLGVLQGGRKLTDQSTIDTTTNFIASVYNNGSSISDYLR